MTNKVVLEIETAIENLLKEGAAEAEKIGAEILTQAKALFQAVTSDPKVLAALQAGATEVVDVAVGAAEGGGAGAIIGAVKGALPAVLLAAEVPAESAAASFVEATLKAKIEAATAATPTVKNP